MSSFDKSKVRQSIPAEKKQIWAVERRRSQNRVAQKNYRQNIKNRLNSLEEINRSLIHNKIVSAIPPSIPPSISPSIPGIGVATYHELHLSNASTGAFPSPQNSTANTNNTELWDDFDLEDINQLLDISSPTDAHQNTTTNGFPTTISSYPSSQSLVLPRFAVDLNLDMHPTSQSTFTDSLSIAKSGTALHLAVRKNHESTARVLIENGADVGALDEEGRTPLHVAAEMGSYDCVQLLINKGAQLELLDHKNMSAVKLAAMNGLVDVVTLLLEHGANANS